MDGRPSSRRSTVSRSKPPKARTCAANHRPTVSPNRESLVLAMISATRTGRSGSPAGKSPALSTVAVMVRVLPSCPERYSAQYMSKSIDFIEYRPDHRSEDRRRTSIAGSAVSSDAVRQSLLERREIALLDVRPEARFAAGHPLFAASFPLDRLEADVYSRLPRRSVPVVVYGEGPGDAAAAARRLSQLGYEEGSPLAGGLGGWTARGGELFSDAK